MYIWMIRHGEVVHFTDDEIGRVFARSLPKSLGGLHVPEGFARLLVRLGCDLVPGDVHGGVGNAGTDDTAEAIGEGSG